MTSTGGDAPARTPAGRALARLRLGEPAGFVRRRLRLAWRTARRVDRRIARCYLAETREAKLHLGCGCRLLDGWLNADLFPRFPDVMRLDATRPFPFPDGAFAFVYSEYMLGSLAFREAPAMLGECFRVLAPGGKVRVATADLAFLIDLYRSERSALRERYVRWAAGRRMAPCRHGLCREWRARRGADAGGEPERRAAPVSAGVFFNHHLHTDGARFVYDAPILGGMLESVGFSNVVRCEPDRSEDPALRGLANEKRMPEGFLRLECLTMEGTKPPAGGRAARR